MLRLPALLQSKIKNQKSKTRGAVAAELALLVAAVYVPLIIGALYMGWLALARGRIHEANHYAIYVEGSQSEDLEERGELTQAFFPEFTGSLRAVEDDAEEPNIPADDELRKLFEAYTEPIHYRNVSARGSFRLVGGRVVYRENIHVDEGERIRPEGQLVLDWRLLEDNIPGDLTTYLQDYLRRRMAHSGYEHSWVHDEDKVVAGGDGVEAWNLDVPNEAARQLKDQWHPEAAIRWTKSRMCGDQSPPAAQQRAWIGTPAMFPGAEPSEDFWHASDGPPPRDGDPDPDP